MDKSKFAVFNPDDLPVGELPVIYGFNNGGPIGFMSACLIAEDGEALGGHCCTSEGYMYGDLGILEGARSDRHETFKAKYPRGYRMDFVSYDDVLAHPGLSAAFEKHEKRNTAAASEASAVSDDR